jgi:hypothetical protein
MSTQITSTLTGSDSISWSRPNTLGQEMSLLSRPRARTNPTTGTPPLDNKKPAEF